MDKRYQVFVSSTFADLQDERRRVIQTVMERDCFPAGIELFPAADEEQWQFIKVPRAPVLPSQVRDATR
jgi:Domain of unknown function (DUF4062)